MVQLSKGILWEMEEAKENFEFRSKKYQELRWEKLNEMMQNSRASVSNIYWWEKWDINQILWDVNKIPSSDTSIFLKENAPGPYALYEWYQNPLEHPFVWVLS